MTERHMPAADDKSIFAAFERQGIKREDATVGKYGNFFVVEDWDGFPHPVPRVFLGPDDKEYELNEDGGVISVEADVETPQNVGPRSIVHAGSRVGYGTEFHGENTVGPDATLGKIVIVRHGTSVRPGADVSDYAKIGEDSIVGEGAQIGKGADVGSKVTVGSQAVVGESATVYRNAHVPAGDEIQPRENFG
jgi:UDP-3-O-[3-hydroxymyristoyl] glucosamine N-acyltransferase